jgi:pimeloyl-ACP methyl ester carboxylesterase
MKTYVLPGFSEKNKEWVEETVAHLSPTMSTEGIFWQHWQDEETKDAWIENEAQKIMDGLGNEKINIIAKSVGTMICMSILKSNPQSVNKIVLCGIPLEDFLPDDEKRYKVLKNFPVKNLLCVQNKDDNHGNYAKTGSFVRSINPNIKIISKPRNDHYYPYSDDFIDFLK